MTSLDTWISQNIPDAVMDDAASWLARLDSEYCNASDSLAFARWLNEDPTHRWAFEELSEVWARLHTLTDVGEQIESSNVTRLPVPNGNNSGVGAATSVEQRSDWSVLIAATLIGIGVFANFIFSNPMLEWSTNVAVTRTVTLPDGTIVELNSKSHLQAKFDERRRDVVLLDGEALFHVAKDSRPFVVKTSMGSVAALGTTFAIDSRPDWVEVTVVSGKVSVSSAAAGVPLTEYDQNSVGRSNEQRAVLFGGDGVEMVSDRLHQQVLASSEIRQKLAWREGNVTFNQQPLGRVIVEMQRYSETKLHIADDELNNLRISGQYSTAGIEEFLTQLTDVYGVSVEAPGQRWVVLRQANGDR